MRQQLNIKRSAWLTALTMLLTVVGCVDPTALFNSEFLATVGLGGKVASLPGDNPAVVVEVENQTQNVVFMELSERDSSDSVSKREYTLQAGQYRAEAWICPVVGVTIGDVSDLSASGARVILGNGGNSDPFVEVEAFGILLQQGINFDCGDKITFSVRPSSATKSGYQVYAYVNRG